MSNYNSGSYFQQIIDSLNTSKLQKSLKQISKELQSNSQISQEEGRQRQQNLGSPRIIHFDPKRQCSIHHEISRLTCMNCEKHICQFCRRDKCKRHLVKNNQQVNDAFNYLLKDYIHYFQQSLITNQYKEDQINKEKVYLQKCIKDEFKQIVKGIKEKEWFFAQSFNKMFQKELNEIKKQRENIENIIQNLKDNSNHYQAQTIEQYKLIKSDFDLKLEPSQKGYILARKRQVIRIKDCALYKIERVIEGLSNLSFDFQLLRGKQEQSKVQMNKTWTLKPKSIGPQIKKMFYHKGKSFTDT